MLCKQLKTSANIFIITSKAFLHTKPVLFENILYFIALVLYMKKFYFRIYLNIFRMDVLQYQTMFFQTRWIDAIYFKVSPIDFRCKETQSALTDGTVEHYRIPICLFSSENIYQMSLAFGLTSKVQISYKECWRFAMFSILCYNFV